MCEFEIRESAQATGHQLDNVAVLYHLFVTKNVSLIRLLQITTNSKRMWSFVLRLPRTGRLNSDGNPAYPLIPQLHIRSVLSETDTSNPFFFLEFRNVTHTAAVLRIPY